MLTALYEAVTATAWGVGGVAALGFTAVGVLAALGAVVYEDLQPKGRHHRV